jgi:GNAT superfamily N-acetyltransferase
MPHPIASPQVTCRPALARDHADVTEFCQGIWEGGDYVPEVWGHWFNDPNGLLITAEYHGRAIGCAKLSQIAAGQWWLEGIRVDPQRQGLKVGSRMHEYLTQWWTEHCGGAIRLLTENPAVIHLCEKTGYTKTHEIRGYRAAPIDEITNNISPATDIHTAVTFALLSESLQANDHLVDFGWRIARADQHIFESYSSYKADFVHTFYWWKDRQGLFSVWEDEEEDKRQLVLGVLACAIQDIPAMLMDIRRFAAHKQFDRVFLLAFLNPQFLPLLEQAGFSTSWKNYLCLFEKQK